MEVRFHSLGDWPGEKTMNPVRPPFKVKWSKILQDLEYELMRLGATDIEIHIDVSPDKIRLDGWPHSSAQCGYQGVVLKFDQGDGSMRFMCDTYDNELVDAWKMNLRAISLTLTALRSVSRYGAVKSGEQYTGFRQLGAPGDNTKRAAAEILSQYSGIPAGEILGSIDTARQAYRESLKRHHPDRNNGAGHQLASEINQAKVELGI